MNNKKIHLKAYNDKKSFIETLNDDYDFDNRNKEFKSPTFKIKNNNLKFNV